MGKVDIWNRVSERRVALADTVEGLGQAQWDSDSGCAGWRVRDVLGHLVYLAEASQTSIAVDFLRNGVLPEQALSKLAIKLGESPVPDLAERLRRSSRGRFHPIGTGRSVCLGEIIVHSEDALRPLGMTAHCPVEDVVLVLGLYKQIGRIIFHARSTKAVRLVASDADWTAGHGPEIEGPALEILLLLANRTGAVSGLSGPGLQIIGI